MNPTEEQRILYDKYVRASVINLEDFTKRNNRKNYYIPHSIYPYEVLYNIEIAKLVAQLTGYSIKTMTYQVKNLKDLKFLLIQKWKMRKNMCTIKAARKKDVNDDIYIYTDFMNKEFGTDIDMYKKIYEAYFDLEKGVQ